jgi:peptidyl-prolyl cis-trans isomerase SurA
MNNTHERPILSVLDIVKRRILILCAGACLFIASPAVSEIVDRIVAQVNEDIITLYELNQSLAPYMKQLKERGAPPGDEQQVLEKARQDVLMNLINDRLTDQEVKKTKTEATDGEVEDAIKRVMEMNHLNQEQLVAALAEDGMSLEDYREDLKKQILRSKLLNREVKSKIVITENDIQTYYQKNIDKFGGGETKYHLRTIIKRIPDYADDKQKQSVLDQMEAVLAELKAGKSFEEMAREHSDLLASEGGDLGMFAMDEISPGVREAIQGLQEGEFTSIIDTDQGYQIFYLQEIRRTADKPLEEVSNEIREILYKEVVDRKFHAWVEGLKQRSHIKIMK